MALSQEVLANIAFAEQMGFTKTSCDSAIIDSLLVMV